MRVIWIIGASPAVAERFERAFTARTWGTDYLVRRAQTLAEIPRPHFEDPGVVAAIDAFNPDFAGFEGIKHLRREGFKGHVYLLGEPAPETAKEPFTDMRMAGSLPPEERSDPYMNAGLMHYQLHFDGKIDLAHFLAPGGRAASETIATLKDFNAFGAKLANFVGRFGIDLALLRKTLMGLSLPHVKTGAGGATIEAPFSVYYGMDPRKVVLAMPTLSRGAGLDAVRNEFCGALGAIKTQTAANSSMFPELVHVARATGNLVLLSGSARNTQESMDPMVLLTLLPFPKNGAPMASVFSFANVRPTEEMTREMATLEANASAAPAPAPASAPEAQEQRAPQGMVQKPDLDKLLADPKVVGDQPVGEGGFQVAEATVISGAAPEAGSIDSTPASAVNVAEMEAVRRQNAQLEDICRAMGEDVRRLIRERREPVTDKELKDAFDIAQEKIKKMQAELSRVTEKLKSREKESELFKTQVDVLKKEVDALKAGGGGGGNKAA